MPEKTAGMTGVGAEQRRAAAKESTTQPIPPPVTGPGRSSDATEVLPPGAGATADNDSSVLARPLHAGVFHSVDLPLVERSNYEVLGEHARGGIGRIMRARDQRTGRLVALKEMLSPHSQALKRFTREALITANLQHPSIIPVYEIGSWSSGEPFIAMKLVAGRSLAEVLKGATLDDRLARLPVLLSVAEALAYAHQRRIIHRDLKPANVLVGDHGETVVIDWGLAKSVDEIESTGEVERIPEPQNIDPTVAGVVLGTPAYMSPEQSRGEQLDERSDVYSIGTMLYHLISGHRPYINSGAKTSREIVDLVATKAPEALAIREPAAPKDLITIANKAMAREPGERYADAGQLADDLRRFLTGQLVAAHHYARRTLFARWVRRNRAPVIVGLVLAIMLAVVGALGVRGVLVERDRVTAQRDLAVDANARAERQLGNALYEKGRVAENAQEWPKAAMYYAASRRHHDTKEAAWAAGLADARAVVPVVRYKEHSAWVHALAIAPDGLTVATVDDAGEVRLWSPVDGRTIARVKAAGTALYAVAFSPDGSEIALAGDDGVIQRRGLDLSPRGTLPGHTGRVWSLVYSPDGSLLASGGEDSKVKLWSLRTADPPRELSGHMQRVYSVTFSADGKRLASGSDDRHVWLWDVATGKGASRGHHDAGGIRVVMFVGADVITTGWDHEIRVWRADGSAPSIWSDVHIVHGAALDPSGEILVTGGETNAIHAWDITTKQRITALDAPGGQTSAVAFSRDGRWLVTAGKSAPIAWDARPLARLHGVGHSGEVSALAMSTDGRWFASGSTDRTMRTWDLATVRQQRLLSPRAACGDGMAILPSGDLAASCDDKKLRRWDAAGTERSLALSTWLRYTATSPDGKTLAAGHVDGMVGIVDVETWQLVTERRLHDHHIYGVAFAPDGRLVTASLDDHMRTWRGRELTADLTVKTESDDGVLSAALAPDGSQLAGGGQDGALRVWDTRSSKWLAHRKDLSAGTIWKLLYTPDGHHAVTAHDDGVLRVWNPAKWDAMPALLDAGEGAALSLAVTPDSKTVVAGYKSGAIGIWDLASGKLRSRIGGQLRDRGSCADIAQQTWVDPDHAAIVTAACTSSAADYFESLKNRSHQELDDEVDVRWQWLPVAARR